MSKTNFFEIAGQPAVVSFVPELNAMRGKFLGLSGYCDFVADSVEGLKREGEISLSEYLNDCREAGIDPYVRQEKTKTFTLRYNESFAEKLTQAAAEKGKSLNAFIIEILEAQLSRI